MGELSNTTQQATPGTNPPIHLPPVPDPRGASGGAPTPGGPSGPQVPEEHGSAVPDSGRPRKKPLFPSPFLPPPAAGAMPSPGSPPSATRSWGTPDQPGQPPAVSPPVVHGGGIGGIDSAGGSRSPYLPDPTNPFPPGLGPNPPFTINPTQGAGPGPGATTPPPEPQLPFVPGYGLRPPGSPSGPPVTETHTTPGTDEASPMAPSGPGFEPVPPSAPGTPGAADEDDSGPRVEIG